MMPFLSVAWSLLSGVFSKLLAIAARVPWYVWLAAAILFIGWRVHNGLETRVFNTGFNKGWAVQEQSLEQWKAANAINMASIQTLQAALKAKNDESIARSEALDKVKADDATDRATLDKVAAKDAARVAVLQGVQAHATANPTCKAPKALTDSLEGL